MAVCHPAPTPVLISTANAMESQTCTRWLPSRDKGIAPHDARTCCALSLQTRQPSTATCFPEGSRGTPLHVFTSLARPSTPLRIVHGMRWSSARPTRRQRPVLRATAPLAASPSGPR
eukprot:UN3287